MTLLVLELRMFAKFMIIGFGGGILIATLDARLREQIGPSISHRNWLLLLLYCLFLLTPAFPGFQVVGWLCLLVGFALVVQGADLFGLITSRPMRFLGVISFNLYLVHGIVYYLAMRMRGGIHVITTNAYILETAVCLIAIVLVSTLIHFAVERPSMALSERISRRYSGGKVPEIRRLAKAVAPIAP